MADVSIANLPAFTGTPTATDLFPMVDTADASESPLGTTKRVTFGQATSTNPGPAAFGGDGYAITLTNPANTLYTALRFMPAGVEQAVIGVNKGNGLLPSADGSFVIRTNNQPLYVATEGATGMVAFVVSPATRLVAFAYAVQLTQPTQVAAALTGTAGSGGYDLQLQPNAAGGGVYIRTNAGQNLVSVINTVMSLINPATGTAIAGFGWSTSALTISGPQLALQTGGTNQWYVQPSGSLVPVNDVTNDVGSVGIRVRNIYSLTLSSTEATLTDGRTAAAFTTLDLEQPSGSPTSTTQLFIVCNNTTTRFEVMGNGGIQNYSANNVNLSDATLKEIGPVVDGAMWYDRFRAIRIRQFRYLDQGPDDWNIGLVAQELETVAPELIDERRHLKVVYTSDLQHAHMAVTQELQRRLQALEARLVQ